MNYYIIQLSNKTNIEIDQEDFDKFAKNSASGNFIKLKRGLVNPSFVVAIIPIVKEETKVTKGHIDPEKGVYVLDSEETVPYRLADGFTQRDQQLLN